MNLLLFFPFAHDVNYKRSLRDSGRGYIGSTGSFITYIPGNSNSVLTERGPYWEIDWTGRNSGDQRYRAYVCHTWFYTRRFHHGWSDDYPAGFLTVDNLWTKGNGAVHFCSASIARTWGRGHCSIDQKPTKQCIKIAWDFSQSKY